MQIAMAHNQPAGSNSPAILAAPAHNGWYCYTKE